MYGQLVSDGIPVAKLVTLVRDGPNVNKTIFQKMDELIRHDNPEFTGLLDLGSCSIHTIHNAFGKGLEKCVVKKLNSSAWIFMHFLSTVQPDVKISEKFRLKWIWI